MTTRVIRDEEKDKYRYPRKRQTERRRSKQTCHDLMRCGTTTKKPISHTQQQIVRSNNNNSAASSFVSLFVSVS